MKFKIYYFKDFNSKTSVEKLKDTHSFVKEIEAQNKEDVFFLMQGENWSRNGEALSLIEQKKLNHTSMSIGDVIEDELGDVFIVEISGFRKLGNAWKEINPSIIQGEFI